MKTIGFDGGANLAELGDVKDVESFFYCINKYSSSGLINFSLITERLYKHYIALDDLDSALNVMIEIRVAFKKVDTSSVNWEGLIGEDTRLDTQKPNLEAVYTRYFNAFIDVVEMAKLCSSELGFYRPVKIVVTDTPYYMSYDKLSLEEYDAVVGKPLWQRGKT